jgi:hypothetical protein
MSFLDPKERFVDIQLTAEGKKQLAQGKLRIEYASFSDANVFYSQTDQFDSGSFTDLNTKRLMFEARSRPQDTIIYESDDSGLLKINQYLGLSGSGDLVRVKSGQVFTTLSGAIPPISSALVQGYSSQILSRSLQNLKELRILKSPSFEDAGESFKLSTNEISFILTKDSPFNINRDIFEIDINQAESVFVDKRLSNLPNFKFLPPINKVKNNVVVPLGNYVSFGSQEMLTSGSLQREFQRLENIGMKKTIEFSDTSTANTLLGQILEVNGGIIRKLDIIDYGEELVESTSNLTRHIYFIGKLYTDDNNTSTFINLMTLVFED